MKPKIIIADDSQTIQKVIKITLANEEFELIECLTDENLIEIVQENNPALVLLDFNLSENKTGYDLSKEIKNICSPKIMMLYGTFDTIEESLFTEAGVNGSIVKPFDGTKFINLCRQLVSDSQLEGNEKEPDEIIEEFSGDEVEEELSFETSDDSEDEMEEVHEVEEALEDEEFTNTDEIEQSQSFSEKTDSEEVTIDDDWVVNQPDIEPKTEVQVEASNAIVTEEELNTLEAGMQDWGMDIPGIIGTEQSAMVELPPVIGGGAPAASTISMNDMVIEEPAHKEELVQEEELVEQEAQFETEEVQSVQVEPEEVADETEAYIEEQSLSIQEEEMILPQDDDLEYPDPSSIVIDPIPENDNISAKLIPVTDLADEVEFDTPDSGFKEISLDATLGSDTEEEIKNIEKQIADEVDAEEELWESDEIVEEAILTPSEIAAKLRKQVITEEEPAKKTVQQVVQKIAEIKISEEDIQKHINQLLAPMVEKIVREKIDSVIEKISWEVIPDLAENLIKKELKQVSEEILHSQDN